MSKFILVSGVLALMALPALADDSPAKDQLTQARAKCRAEQSRLAPLERHAPWCTDDQNLIQARDAAERSCGEAVSLMITAGLEPKPVQPRPAPPTPTLTVVEKVRLTSEQAATQKTEFAAIEMDRNCPGKSGRRSTP